AEAIVSRAHYPEWPSATCSLVSATGKHPTRSGNLRNRGRLARVAGQGDDLVDGVGVGQGAHADRLLERNPGQHPLDRDLELLAGQGPGDLGDGVDAVGHVAGAELGPD